MTDEERKMVKKAFDANLLNATIGAMAFVGLFTIGVPIFFAAFLGALAGHIAAKFA